MFLSRFLIKIADEEQLVIAGLDEREENHLVRLVTKRQNKVPTHLSCS